MTYVVSFNDGNFEIGGYEDGDTVDFYGEDLKSLIDHVIANDPNFPMVFIESEDDSEVGYFCEADDKSKVAVMYITNGSIEHPVEVKPIVDGDSDKVEHILNNIGDWESSCLFSFITDLLTDLNDEQLNKLIKDQGF